MKMDIRVVGDAHMKRQTWKAEELYLGKRMGGTRNPVTGRTDDRVPDLNVPIFSPEVKLGRNALSAATIKRALDQAAASAAKDGKVPIAICSQSSGRGIPRRRVVCMEFEVFCGWLGLGEE